MATIAILGAGIGGIPMAYEMRALASAADRVVVISADTHFRFTPSNPWVAVDWRTPEQISVDLAPILHRQKIEFVPIPAKKVKPDDNQVELENGDVIDYDYLVIATGPELAFDEVDGLGPDGFTSSICTTHHSSDAAKQWRELCEKPGPIVVGAVQGASCFGPAYEFAMIMDTDLKRRKIRDQVPMTFVTSEPYVGHLGLDGVGDTKTMLESEMRNRHIRWITNAKVQKVEDGKMVVEEVNTDGTTKATHELPFSFSMMLPAFRGIDAVKGIDGLVNPRGFVIVDQHQRNPKYQNIFGVGVCIAIAPPAATPVPTGVPKTGFMIESMVTASAHNIRNLMDGKEPDEEATWNAVCFADFGDGGVAFVAQPQIPPRNVNWASEGKWVHLAKIAFEKYFLRKVKRGTSEPFYEKKIMNLLGISKLKASKKTK